MSTARTEPEIRPRRVRHEVRDGLAVMAFSAVVSVGLTLVITVLVGLGR
jgi:hypothetical protein